MSQLTCPHCQKPIAMGPAWAPPPKACPACRGALALFDFRLVDAAAPLPTTKSEATSAVDLNREGMRAVARGALEDAIRLFDSALALKPNFPAALNNRGYARAAAK